MCTIYIKRNISVNCDRFYQSQVHVLDSATAVMVLRLFPHRAQPLHCARFRQSIDGPGLAFSRDDLFIFAKTGHCSGGSVIIIHVLSNDLVGYFPK